MTDLLDDDTYDDPKDYHGYEEPTMKTNKWKIEELIQNEIFILRIQDNIPIAKMITSTEDGDELLTRDEALDIANQLVDDWNFSCEELD